MWPTSSLFMPWIYAPKYRDATWGKGSAYRGGEKGCYLQVGMLMTLNDFKAKSWHLYICKLTADWIHKVKKGNK